MGDRGGVRRSARLGGGNPDVQIEEAGGGGSGSSLANPAAAAMVQGIFREQQSVQNDAMASLGGITQSQLENLLKGGQLSMLATQSQTGTLVDTAELGKIRAKLAAGDGLEPSDFEKFRQASVILNNTNDSAIDMRNVLYGAINQNLQKDKDVGTEFARPMMSKKYLMTKQKTYTDQCQVDKNCVLITLTASVEAVCAMNPEQAKAVGISYQSNNSLSYEFKNMVSDSLHRICIAFKQSTNDMAGNPEPGVDLSKQTKILLGYQEHTAVSLKNKCHGYYTAQQWYKQRKYQMVNETLKFVISPVTYEDPVTSKFTGDGGYQRQVPLPTIIQTVYNANARQKYFSAVSALGIGDEISYYAKTLQDKIVTLEPQRRTVNYVKEQIQSYDDAAADWEKKRNSKSLRNYMSRDVYEKVVVQLEKEIALLDTKIGLYEWPRAKISYASFINSMFILWVYPLSLSLVDKGQSTLEGATLMNFSIKAKYLWKREVSTPIFDRIQFTKNMKSVLYKFPQDDPGMELARTLQGWVDPPDYNITTKNIGIILRKKKRMQLKQIIGQLDYQNDVLQLPMFQQAFKLYQLMEATSMNIRRLMAFSIYEITYSNFQNTEQVQGNVHFLQPFEILKTPRYQVVYQSSTGDELDRWHLAYKTLAESHIRSKFQRRTRKLFKYFKRVSKIIYVMKTRYQFTKTSQLLEMINYFNPSVSLVVFFYMSIAWSTSPPMITKDLAQTGYGIQNALGAKSFTDLFRDIDKTGNTDPIIFLLGLLEQCKRASNEALSLCKVALNREGTISQYNATDMTAIEVDTLTNFCGYYYPGVSTLLKNNIVIAGQGEVNLDSITLNRANLLGGQVQDVDRMSKIERYRIFTAFVRLFEVIETGLIMLQQYNAAYYKGISDTSYFRMLRCWFKLCIIECAPSFLVQIVQQGSLQGKYLQELLDHTAVFLRAIIEHYIRPPRRDRVKSKIKRSAPALDMFSDLHAILFVNESKFSVELTGDTRSKYTRAARRGYALHISNELLGLGKEETMQRMKTINEVEKDRQRQIIGLPTKGKRKQMTMTSEQQKQMEKELKAGGIYAFERQQMGAQQPNNQEDVNMG